MCDRAACTLIERSTLNVPAVRRYWDALSVVNASLAMKLSISKSLMHSCRHLLLYCYSSENFGFSKSVVLIR